MEIISDETGACALVAWLGVRALTHQRSVKVVISFL